MEIRLLFLTVLGSMLLAHAATATFPVACDVARPAVFRYLNEHGLGAYEHEIDHTFQSAPLEKHIVDAAGQRVDTWRVRRDFTVRLKSLWVEQLVWSPSNLRASGLLKFKPDNSECVVDLQIRFSSGAGVTFLVIFPLDGGEYHQSNGRLEKEFLTAMVAGMPRTSGSN
jgi:hypothetical protein